MSAIQLLEYYNYSKINNNSFHHVTSCTVKLTEKTLCNTRLDFFIIYKKKI